MIFRRRGYGSPSEESMRERRLVSFLRVFPDFYLWTPGVIRIAKQPGHGIPFFSRLVFGHDLCSYFAESFVPRNLCSYEARRLFYNCDGRAKSNRLRKRPFYISARRYRVCPAIRTRFFWIENRAKKDNAVLWFPESCLFRLLWTCPRSVFVLKKYRSWDDGTANEISEIIFSAEYIILILSHSIRNTSRLLLKLWK